jgi:hypothetical protein
MDVSGAEPIGPASKLYWGPRVWRLFHLLAEVSDRRDMCMLWNSAMRLTATTMPCEACRNHLGAYMKSHVFVRFARTHALTGESVRLKARVELLNLHNDVNVRLGKPAFTLEELATYSVSRGEALAEVSRLLEEIKAAWTPLVHTSVSGPAFSDWKKHLHMMLALARGGPL